MKNIWLFLFVILLSTSFLMVSAIAKEDIAYPVAELGNCESEDGCKEFCDQPQNFEICLDFAEKHDLISEGELQLARKFMELGEGPEKCKTPATCEEYCNDISHINECLAFAEENGLMSAEELEEAKKVQAALAKGAELPGNCRNKEECESYCSNPDYMAECIAFAEATGFIPPEELEEARKVLQAIEKGAKPPPCRGKAECDIYCTKPEHFEECLTFAESAGLIPSGELEDAKKVLQAIKKGVKPPPCRGKQECDEYCATHIEECITFAEAAGFISKEEAKMIKKTGGTGPGGCRSKEECDSFCQEPANQEVCFKFAMEHGLIPEAELQKIEEGKRRMQEALSQAPPEVMDCLVQELGQDTIEKIRAGTMMPTEAMGAITRGCFERFMPPEGEAPPTGGEQTPSPSE